MALPLLRLPLQPLLAAAPAPAAAPAVAPVAQAAAVAEPAPMVGQFEIPPAYRGKVMDGDRVEEMSNMRSKIAEHMVVSKHVSPHVATVWEVDFSRVADLRKSTKPIGKSVMA